MQPLGLLILLVAVACFGVWARWLWKSTPTPRPLCVVAAVLIALVAGAAFVSAHGM